MTTPSDVANVPPDTTPQHRARHSRRTITPPRRRAKPAGAATLTVVRLAISLLVAVALAGVWWALRPTGTSLPDDIVGYPSFYNTDYRSIFLGHRLTVWFVPVLTAGIYTVLSKWGPLRGRTGVTPDPEKPATTEPSSVPAVDPRDGRTVLRLAWLLPPATVVAVAVSSRSTHLVQHISLLGLGAGVCYVLVVLAIGLGLSRRLPGSAAVATVNSLAAALGGVGSIAWYARYTGTVDSAGVYRQWDWIPWWFAALSAVLALAYVGLQLRMHRPERVQQMVVVGFVGAAAVYLLVAYLPGAIGPIQGFDDSHSVTGADLLARGYFPWRDVLFMHGVFEDGLRSTVGFALFEESYWGAEAAYRMIWVPVLWVSYYLLLVWAAPQKWFLHLLFITAVPWMSLVLPVSVRWVAVAVVFVLLGQAIRRQTPTMTAVLTAVLFCFAILVPEASFQVLAVAAVLVLSDLSRRDRRVRWWRGLRRTRDFVLTGLLLTILWVAYLVLNRALRPWIDYYLIFGPGHAASGTFPVDLLDNGVYTVLFVISELIVAATVLVCLIRIIERRPFTTEAWVALAAAIAVGLYAEKGLGRFDSGHILQVLTVAIPLWVVLIVVAVRVVTERGWRPLLERSHRSSPVGKRSVTRRAPYAAAAIALALCGIVVPALVGGPSTASAAQRAAGSNHVEVPSQALAPDRVGYALQGADGPNVAMVSDLAKLLRRITPPGETVFDYTNSPGYFSYLLQEDLATRFYTIGLALPEVSQELLLDELAVSNPAVVVFDDQFYGLPVWDGPRNEVRHFEISPYLLDGWTPVASTYGFLFMVRNDLVPDLPALPRLDRPVQTTDLYYSMPPCEWGYIPNFLSSKSTGLTEELSVGPYTEANWETARGWAIDPATGSGANQVVVAITNQVVGTTTAILPRPDVATALADPQLLSTGFSTSFSTPLKGVHAAYAVLSDGLAHPIGSAPLDIPAQLVRPDGSAISTSPDAVPGTMDDLVSEPRLTAEVTVPDGLDISAFGLATFSTDGGPLDEGKVELDDPSGPSGLSRGISFQTLPSGDDSVAVRVGACLQWRGYRGNTLLMSQVGGDEPITGVSLSGVSE